MSEHVGEHLSAYLDGELSAVERERFQAHLASCGECARRLRELQAVDAVVRRDPVNAPEGYFDDLPARIRERASQARIARRPTRVPVWALAAAATLLVGVLAPLALRDQPRPTPEPPRAAALEQKRVEPAQAPAGAPQPPPSAPRMEDAQLKKALARDARADEPALKSRLAAPQPSAPPPAAPPASRFAEPPAGPAGAENEARAQRRPETQKEELAVAGPMMKQQQQAGFAGSRDEQKLGDREADKGAVAQPRERAKVDVVSSAAEAAPPASAAGARASREAWRRVARESTDPATADAARVRAIEMSVRAFELERRPADHDAAIADGEAYLARANAAEPERVRALLARLKN